MGEGEDRILKKKKRGKREEGKKPFKILSVILYV
jgi:hypothetical protein